MNNDQWFFINDFDDFVDHSRSLVFKFFGEVKKETEDNYLMMSISQMSQQELEEMDETLTHDESAIIIMNHARKQINKKTKEVRYCLTDKLLQSIIDDMNSRMIRTILNSLVNKGVLDSAYDSDQNDFIFWVKEEEEEDDTKSNQKPETD